MQAYDLLCRLEPSRVLDLNRAIAVGHHSGPEAGLQAFEALPFLGARKPDDKAWSLAPTNAEEELICRKLDNLPDHTEPDA